MKLKRRGGCKFGVLVAVGAPRSSEPFPDPPPANPPFQFLPVPADRPYRLTARPNAPLGADLCIFNKFREFPRRAGGDLSAGGYGEGGFSAASQTVSSRLFMCEEFAIHHQLSFHLLPPAVPHPRHSSLPFAFRPPPCSADLAFSFPLYTYIRASPLRPLPPSLYLFLCHIRAANFSSVFLLPIFLLHLSLLLALPPPLTPAPLFLARFISARCQFEFGTRATGQRVSTKNQFLNARLFRAEGPACIFPSPASPPSALRLFVPLLPRFFFDGTPTPRRTSSSEATELARPMTTLRYER